MNFGGILVNPVHTCHHLANNIFLLSVINSQLPWGGSLRTGSLAMSTVHPPCPLQLAGRVNSKVRQAARKLVEYGGGWWLLVSWNKLTPWTAACQTFLSSAISQSLLKFMSIESVILSTSSFAAPFSFCLQSSQASGSFPLNQLFASGGQSIRASASASVLPMNIQCWFPLGRTGLIALLSKGLSRVFSRTPFWKHQFFGA